MSPQPVATRYMIELSIGDALGIIGLAVSLVGNILQWQQTRSIKNSLYNALVGIFNEVGWILSYCISREKAVSNLMPGAGTSSRNMWRC